MPPEENQHLANSQPGKRHFQDFPTDVEERAYRIIKGIEEKEEERQWVWAPGKFPGDRES